MHLYDCLCVCVIIQNIDMANKNLSIFQTKKIIIVFSFMRSQKADILGKYGVGH